MEDWAEIRRLFRSEGLSGRAIAERLGVARNTVASALASQQPPKYERVSRGSAVDEFEPAIRLLLEQFPSMPSTVIAELSRSGWCETPRTLWGDRTLCTGLLELIVGHGHVGLDDIPNWLALRNGERVEKHGGGLAAADSAHGLACRHVVAGTFWCCARGRTFQVQRHLTL